MKILAYLAVTAAFCSTQAAVKPVVAEFKNSRGEDVGKATLTETSGGVKVSLDLKHLPPGVHGFHLHENGKCSGPDFTSAGSHFSPEGRSHGFKSEKGPHAGDFDNLTVKEDGTVHAEFLNKRIKLDQGKDSVMRKGGTALVIHAKADDYLSQPSGDAGDRIACAEIHGPGEGAKKGASR